MWHLETFVIVLRHRLPHYFQTVISEAPRGLSSATSRWQHWAGQCLASLSSTSHYSERAKPFTQRNRTVVEAEMASCTRTHEHGQKRVSKSSQIQTKSPTILQNNPCLQMTHKNIVYCLCTSQAHPHVTRNLLSPSVQARRSYLRHWATAWHGLMVM